MTFLSPFALLWLGSIPALFWLWRLAATRHRIRVPSLVPFESLARRAPHRRTRLVVNRLFWLQLAALILLAVALTGPVLFQQRAKTILVVMDTSASMGARLRGADRFERAKQRLMSRLKRKGSSDQVFLVSSAPVASAMEQPQQELADIRQALGRLRVSHLPGNLATAAHIGRALLGGSVDETLVVTDEVAPPSLPSEVEFLSVHEPLPNLAIVGFDARGGFCSEARAHLVVTVQNFSKDSADIRVTATQGARQLAQTSASLEPGERANLSLAVPEGSDDWVDVSLTGSRDALAVDNRAHVLLRYASTLPVAVVSDLPVFRRVMGEWLDACEGLTWTEGFSTAAATPQVVVTDGPFPDHPTLAGTLRWVVPSSDRRITLAHWTVDSDHPVGSYLGPVEVVAASLGRESVSGAAGEPVVWSLIEGQRTPVVVTDEREGRRQVSIFLDPVESPHSVPLLMVFFNSLRWLMGQPDVVRTGEPIIVPTLSRGAVTVRRPDGTTERLHHEGGPFHYDATARVGRYRITQGAVTATWAANFLDPLESNLQEPVSTWQPAHGRTQTALEAMPLRRPLARTLALVILALVLFEWWLYSRKRVL